MVEDEPKIARIVSDYLERAGYRALQAADGRSALAGRGVAPEELPRLFERFHRSADSPGTGLGLVIARDLVRAHGGEIAASSEGEGRGMTVRFTLPVVS